jgi:hypothetical protein
MSKGKKFFPEDKNCFQFQAASKDKKFKLFNSSCLGLTVTAKRGKM